MNNFWLDRKKEGEPLPWLTTSYLKSQSLQYELKRLEGILSNKINDDFADLLLTTKPNLSREEMREIIKKNVAEVIALEYERHSEYYYFVGACRKWLITYFVKYFNAGW